MSIELAVLASGSGTNLQALLDIEDLKNRIAVVISDNPQSKALGRASDAAIPTSLVPWSSYPDREAFADALAAQIEGHRAKGVILAGFMRILPPSFVHRFPDRILNVHPSLLPSFPGAHAVENALERGVKVTGVTVHFVDEEVDHGPIVAQRPVPVEPGDTIETLHARIQAEEHRVYPEVVRAFLAGRLSVEGRKVMWK